MEAIKWYMHAIKWAEEERRAFYSQAVRAAVYASRLAPFGHIKSWRASKKEHNWLNWSEDMCLSYGAGCAVLFSACLYFYWSVSRVSGGKNKQMGINWEHDNGVNRAPTLYAICLYLTLLAALQRKCIKIKAGFFLVHELTDSASKRHVIRIKYDLLHRTWCPQTPQTA